MCILLLHGRQCVYVCGYGLLGVRPNDDKHDLAVFLNNRCEEMTGDITTKLAEKRGIKFYLTCILSTTRHGSPQRRRRFIHIRTTHTY